MPDDLPEVQDNPTVEAERAARRAEVAAALANQPQSDEPAFRPEDATPEAVAADPLARDRRVHIGRGGATDGKPGWKNYECAICRTPSGDVQFAWLDPRAIVAHLAEFHRYEPAE